MRRPEKCSKPSPVFIDKETKARECMKFASFRKLYYLNSQSQATQNINLHIHYTFTNTHREMSIHMHRLPHAHIYMHTNMGRNTNKHIYRHICAHRCPAPAGSHISYLNFYINW